MAKKSNQKSKAEIDLQYQMHDSGIPEPDREVEFCDERKWRFDFAWPEHMIAVEVEGGVYNQGRHTRPKGYESDCEKYSVAAIKGWVVVRVTTGMIKSGKAIKLIQQAIENHYQT